MHKAPPMEWIDQWANVVRQTIGEQMLAKEKDSSVLAHTTSQGQNIFNVSIPHPCEAEKLAITMEPTIRDPVGIESFLGSNSDFKQYLRAKQAYLIAGVIG